MSAGHTRGPWMVTHDATRYAIYSRVNRSDKNQEISECPQSLVAFVPRDSRYFGGDDKSELADAYLIASAPDLLAALQSVLSGVKYDDSGNGYAEVVIDTQAIVAARCAVAAALGEQQ